MVCLFSVIIFVVTFFSGTFVGILNTFKNCCACFLNEMLLELSSVQS